MTRSSRIHLRVRNRKRTACGLLIQDGTRLTYEASQVTCDRCLRSFFVADQDIHARTHTRSNHP